MIHPHEVKTFLARHLLTEGFDIIFDLERSRGSWFVDLRNGERYLDFFSMYASMAVGYNHPRLLRARDELGSLAVNKPTNSDVYTPALAQFVETFVRLAMPAELPHLFFIEGGALAVENALKTAFDWKVRKNLAAGRRQGGSQVIHFRQAFHGRSGYTLSLTNTADPRKTKYFPTFDWPRVTNPKLTFPLNTERLAQVEAAEAEALQQILQSIDRQPEEIAALIIEPIQGEGGDNHFRLEFLQALRRLCDEHELLLVFDEIQTGFGLTGRFWAHEHFDLRPDVLVFGKKSQVCGILASRRIDQVGCHVFQERSRLNSTFGGNLLDMARCTHILRIIEEEKLVANARRQGELLLAGVQRLSGEFPDLITNPRGRGLMCAFDLPDGRQRDQLVKALFRRKLLLVGCGECSIRFRPHLIVTAEEIEEGLAIIRRVLQEGSFAELQVDQDPCLLAGA
ncbi:MAG: L-lysine 6-transaminase [Desulfuromonadales bacterium]|nr:L-lysine 6-transaminase [Desulfuromonadales bacterium]